MIPFFQDPFANVQGDVYQGDTAHLSCWSSKRKFPVFDLEVFIENAVNYLLLASKP